MRKEGYGVPEDQRVSSESKNFKFAINFRFLFSKWMTGFIFWLIRIEFTGCTTSMDVVMGLSGSQKKFYKFPLMDHKDPNYDSNQREPSSQSSVNGKKDEFPVKVQRSLSN